MGWYSEQDQSKRDEINAKRRKDYADDKERFSLALAAHYGVDPALYRRLPNDTLKAAYGRLQVLISKVSSPVPNPGPSPGPNPAPSPAPSPGPSLAQRPDPSPDPNLAQSPDPSPVPSPAPKNVTNSRIPKSNSMMDDECGLKSGAVDDSIQPDEISSLPSDLVEATISFAAASQSEEKRGWHYHLDSDGSPVVESNSVAARRRIISSSSSNTTRVFDNKHPKNYNQNEVSNWLRSIGLGHKAVLFEEHAVDGSMLETLTEEDLRVELGLSKLQSRKFKLSLEKACGIVHFCDDESDESVAKRRKISDNKIEDNNEEVKENVETYYSEFHDEYCSYGEELDRKGEEEEIII